jgi:hypothetical protein
MVDSLDTAGGRIPTMSEEVRRDRSTLMVAWRMLNKAHTWISSIRSPERHAITEDIEATMNKIKDLNLALAPVRTRRSRAQIRQEVEAVVGRRGRTAARRGA